MPVQQGDRAPYASTDSVLKVVDRHRRVGLRNMDIQKLQTIGVTEALAPRTLQSLILLDFYADSGQVTPEFDALRQVPEHDFKPRLAELLRTAYAPILEVLDPATATTLDIENAFRGYEPTGQIKRMVHLFVGLMSFAEVMPEPERRRTATVRAQTAAKGSASRTTGKAGRRSEREPPSERLTPPTRTDGHRVTARLGDAGEVTLIVDINPIRLSGDDRTFVFDLVDKINTKAAESSASTSPDKQEDA